MICPQTKAECAHNCSAWMISCKEAVKPPPPTLEEIERLAGDVSLALSALMAAIRAYGRE